jgi:hypothetical protein
VSSDARLPRRPWLGLGNGDAFAVGDTASVEGDAGSASPPLPLPLLDPVLDVSVRVGDDSSDVDTVSPAPVLLLQRQRQRQRCIIELRRSISCPSPSNSKPLASVLFSC